MKEIDDVILMEPTTAALSQVMQYDEELFEFGDPNVTFDDLNMDIGLMVMNNPNGKKRLYIPLQDTDKGMTYIDPKKGLNLDGARLGIDGHAQEITDCLDRTILFSPGTIAARTAKVMKDQINLTNSPDYIKCIKDNPIHALVMGSMMVSYPTPLYQTGVDPKTNKPIYEKDNEKYTQMMEKYGFIKLLEDNQKFTMESTLPYVKAKENGTLTDEQAKEYKKNYMAHLQSLKESCRTIQGIDLNDECVKGNKTVVTNGAMDLRWKNEFKNVADKIDTIQNALGNGWATRDYGTLIEIMKWRNRLEVASKNKEYKPEEREQFKAQLADTKEAYDALFSTKVDTPEKRENLLKNIKKKIEKHDENSSVIDMIEDTLAAKVNKAEIGIITTAKNIEYDDFVVVNDKYGINNSVDSKDERLSGLGGDPDVNDSISEVEAPVADEKKIGLKAFSNKAMKKQVDEIYKAMKKVDYFMFGKSSDEFNEMMESVSQLKEQMDRMTDYSDTPNADRLAVFGDLVAKSTDKIIGYLNKKQDDFDKDGTRRDSKDKQTREQNRIQTAIESYEKLIGIYKQTKKTFEDEYIPGIKEKIKEELASEEKVRSNPDISLNKYKASVAKSFFLVGLERGNTLNMPETRSMKDYVERMSDYKVPHMSDKETSKVYNGSPELKKMVKKVVDKEIPKNAKGENEITYTAEIRGHYNEAVKNKAKEVKAFKGMGEYREALLSNQRKQQLAAKQQAPSK